ncbi:MAG TPA: SDR family oxidoreductase [Euzebyales bacterium]|nr:SDR family oxidoreductase [Euzebyales bacterium]
MSISELFDIKGRVAIVTGGSRGLGLQIAEAYAELGAHLALTARKPEQLDHAAEHLRRMGAQVETVAGNLSDPDHARALVRRVMDAWGRIDILVNNAGTTWGAPAEEHPLEAWHKVVDLNLTGTFVLTQAVANADMIPRRRGRIINVASVAGLKGNHPRMMGTVAYNTTKGGLVNMTRALAVEWARHGITVNAIAPGYFPTKMSRGTLEQAQELIEEATPLGRVGGPEDLKGVAVLLASDASAYMTGQVIAVDGGISAR